jgi:hypothetical protein
VRGGGVALAREHCKWRRRAAFGQCSFGLRRGRTLKLVKMCREQHAIQYYLAIITDKIKFVKL